MLYFKALRNGIDPMPAANADIRAAIEAQAKAEGWPALHAQLAKFDPETAARLAPMDSQRIQRALEVYQISGIPLSVFHLRQKSLVSALISEPSHSQSIAPLISLEPADRAWLHERIAQRFDQMLSEGLMDEVHALRSRGDLHADLPSMRCVGYRQAWEALEGVWPMAELRDKGIFATRQLAKRQITWLRSMSDRIQIECDSSDALDQVLQCVRKLMSVAQATSPAGY
jgi:tRNA dimethylallyltransferase